MRKSASILKGACVKVLRLPHIVPEENKHHVKFSYGNGYLSIVVKRPPTMLRCRVAVKSCHVLHMLRKAHSIGPENLSEEIKIFIYSTQIYCKGYT